MSKNVADVIIETLVLAGVKRVYGITGDSLNGLADSIRKNGKIEWAHVRHEETGAFAAGAEAHLTENFAVCVGSCGPGNLHLINGLYDCQRSRVPVLAIAAHIPSHEIGTSFFQETHPELIFKECSHYCELVSNPDNLPKILEIAMRTAISKRGVAVVVIPGDIILKLCNSLPSKISGLQTETISYAGSKDLKKAAELLNSNKKITILGGAGCANSHDEIIKLAEKLQAPLVHALRGKEYLEYDNPFNVGLTGLIGMPAGYNAINNCDVLLMLGTDFPYRQFYPKHAKIIQVDIRGEQIGRRANVNIGLVGDVKYTLQKLTPLIKEHTDKRFLNKCLADFKKTNSSLDRGATGTKGRIPIHPQYAAKMINEVAADNAIFTCDVGTPSVWAARYLKMNGQRRLLGSFVHGSMASALPQAIGAQSEYPKRQVISLSGDGGLAMLMGDILTLKQLKLPIKIVVFNNSSLNFVELEMKAAGLLDFATDLENPDFAKLAESVGLLGLRAEKPEDVKTMLEQAFSYEGPALIDIVVNRQELIMPPTITKEEIIGFNKFLLKALTNNRINEVIDIAKTNIMR